MMNLFAWVTAYPDELALLKVDPVGENDNWLLKMKGHSERVIFAWGNFKEATKRAEVVKNMFPRAMVLGVNKNGTPKHPLYVRSSVIPEMYDY